MYFSRLETPSFRFELLPTQASPREGRVRIICCNKYYFLNGGTERYLQNVMYRLAARGHEPVPFSVAYADSWPTPYSRYFLPPPGGARATTFCKLRPGFSDLVVIAIRAVYSPLARIKLGRLLDETGGADAAYLLNIYNYMSPSIIDTFKKRGVRVVMRLGDFHLVCPSHSLLRRHTPCELCVRGGYWHGLVHRCVHGSLGASALRVLGMYVQRALRLYEAVDAFVTPCAFMRDKLVEGGFPARRISVLPQPAEEGLNLVGEVEKNGTILYFGRLSEEKGLDSLLQAYQDLAPPAKLLIVGRSYDGCVERLKALVRPGFENRIEFRGFRQGEELSRLIGQASLSVVPSRCHDNAPQSVVESFLHSTPVLGSRMGGIPEQITPGLTGELFDPYEKDGLKNALARMLADPARLAAMGRNAREYARTTCSFDAHIDALLPIFAAR